MSEQRRKDEADLTREDLKAMIAEGEPVEIADVPPEETLRSHVSVAEMVEDHPDPAGEVKLWPLVEADPGPEDVDGW